VRNGRCSGGLRGRSDSSSPRPTAALRSDLADEAKKTIEDAPRYAGGRAVRITVRYRHDIENVLKVAAIKMAN
jgi:hypothetical protein